MPLDKPYRRATALKPQFFEVNYEDLRSLTPSESADSSTEDNLLISAPPQAGTMSATLVHNANHTLAPGTTTLVDIEDTGNSGTTADFEYIFSLTAKDARHAGIGEDYVYMRHSAARGYVTTGGDNRVIVELVADAANGANMAVRLKAYRVTIA